MIKISPSILSSDFSNLETEVRLLEKSGADMIHIDVMDGIFVNNITMGPVILKSIRNKTVLPFDVHLMIIDPIKFIESFVNAGSDIISIHYEANSDIRETLKCIKFYNKKAGLVINPNTPAEVTLDFLDIIDLIVIMTVEPGFSGQKFMYNILPKIKLIKEYINKSGKDIELEIDGGVDDLTVKEVIKYDIDIVVAGSYIFNSNNYKNKIQLLKSLSCT